MSVGLRYMMLAALFFSLMSAQVKLAGQSLPVGEIVVARAFVTLVLAWTTLRVRRIPPWGNNRRLLLLRGFFGVLALNGFFYAVVHLPLAEATVLHFMSPVFTALLAAALLGERPRAIELVGGAISFAGVVIFASPGAQPPGAHVDGLAIAVALLATIASAAAYSTVRELRRTDHPDVVVFYFPLLAFPASLPLLLMPGTRWPVGTEWLLLAGVGVTTHIAQACLTRAIHLEPAARATSVSYVQIVFASVWSALLFDTWPTGAGLVGIALVVTGTLIVVRTRAAREGA